MPKYSKTRKGAPAGHDYVTASPVMIGDVAVTVALGKSGAYKIATPVMDGVEFTGKGKSFDDAIDDLVSQMSPAQDAPKGESVEPVAETLPVDDDTPKGESTETEESAPEMSAAEISAQGLKVIRDARDAFTDYATHGNGATVANRAAMEACTKIGELSQMITDADLRARFYTYGTKIAEHYYGRTGGGDGVLTGAQRNRAFQKFGKVCAALAA